MIYQDKLQSYISITMVSLIVFFISTTIGLIWFSFKSNEKPDSLKKWISLLLGAFVWSAFLSMFLLGIISTFDTICESLQEFVYPNIDKVLTTTELITFTFVDAITVYFLLDMFIRLFAPNFYQSSKLLNLRKSSIYWAKSKLTKEFGAPIMITEILFSMMITLSIVWTGIINLYNNNVISMLAMIVVGKAWTDFCSDCEIKNFAFIDVLINVFKKKTN